MLILGERIKTLRISRGWTQEELAGKTDTTKHVISNWERNKGNPDPEQITALANTFEVSADYLLGLSNFPEPHFRDPFGQIFLMPAIDYSFVKGSTWDLLKLLRSGISLTVDANEIVHKDKELIATIIEAIHARSNADACEVIEEPPNSNQDSLLF